MNNLYAYLTFGLRAEVCTYLDVSEDDLRAAVAWMRAAGWVVPAHW